MLDLSAVKRCTEAVMSPRGARPPVRPLRPPPCATPGCNPRMQPPDATPWPASEEVALSHALHSLFTSITVRPGALPSHGSLCEARADSEDIVGWRAARDWFQLWFGRCRLLARGPRLVPALGDALRSPARGWAAACGERRSRRRRRDPRRRIGGRGESAEADAALAAAALPVPPRARQRGGGGGPGPGGGARRGPPGGGAAHAAAGSHIHALLCMLRN